MKGICPPTSQHRDHVLETFGSLVSTIPFDSNRVDEARDGVVKEGGKELLVETCAVAGAFEAITKLVDGSGRQFASKLEIRAKTFVMKTFKHRYAIAFFVATIAVAVIMVAPTIRR